MRAGLWTVPAAFVYSISVNLFHANQRLMLIGIMPLGLYMAHCGFRNRVPDWLFNRWTHARAWYEEHFTKYGSGGCLSYGKRIYLIDDWPGYDWCLDPRCTHYRCEHGLGVMTSVWAKDPEMVGASIDFGQGCANADCPCESFQGRQLADS